MNDDPERGHPRPGHRDPGDPEPGHPEPGHPTPIPKGWLPSPVPPEDAETWDLQVRRIMAAAAAQDADATRVDDPRRPFDGPLDRPLDPSLDRWSGVGHFWRHAAVLAAAAIALLFMVDLPEAAPRGTPASLSLGLMVAQGDPSALWAVSGVEADPVLALIAAQQADDANPTDGPGAADAPGGSAEESLNEAEGEFDG